MAPTVLSDITVVVPTVGRPSLRRTLGSLAGGEVWPAEVVVSQQGEDPVVPSCVEDLRRAGMTARHLRFRQLGTAAATNRGLERLRTGLVAVTHDDCVARPDWLARMAAALREDPDVVVTGRVEPEGGTDVPSFITDAEPRTYRRRHIGGDPLYPANMGFSRWVLDRVGPFDEDPRLRHAEDNEWSYRALGRGVPIRYDPDVVVCHLAWRDRTQRAATYRDYARSQGAFYGKYLRRGDRSVVTRLALDAVRGPLAWGLGVLRRDEELGISGRASVRGFLPGVVTGFQRSRDPVA